MIRSCLMLRKCLLLHVRHPALSWARPLFTRLLRSVITSNALRSGFDPARIHTLLGTYMLLQSKPPDTTSPSRRSSTAHCRTDDGLPRRGVRGGVHCPRCGPVDVPQCARSALVPRDAAGGYAYGAFVAGRAVEGGGSCSMAIDSGDMMPVRVNGGARHAMVPAELVRQRSNFGGHAMEFEALRDACSG
ncbi:hypothetical protein K438DRAFT_530614 [Mycena galopus ATCC 62051]|nr:hypothetical protein K438DRAFT_530614 [Mycena galopus ATCC 62051]